MVKNPPANAGDTRRGFDSESVRFSEGGHGNPLQYSCLENPTDREAWQATVHRVTDSDMTEVDLACMHAHTPMLYKVLTLFQLVTKSLNKIRIKYNL